MVSKSEIKYIKSLRLKKFRQKYSQFIAEGEKIVLELCTSNYKVHKIFCLEEHLPLFEEYSIEVQAITPKELNQMSNNKTPQGTLAIVDIPNQQNIEDTGLLLGLDNIQDPGNLGTMVRIADWYGIKAIICSTDCVDLYNPKTISSSMGSFCRVQVLYTSLDDFLEQYKNPVYACVLEGESIYEIDKPKDALIVIGNEGNGISEEIIDKSSNKITIPRLGNAESLNAAIATAVVIDNFKKPLL